MEQRATTAICAVSEGQIQRRSFERGAIDDAPAPVRGRQVNLAARALRGGARAGRRDMKLGMSLLRMRMRDNFLLFSVS